MIDTNEKETMSNKKALLLLLLIIFPSIIIVGIMYNELNVKPVEKDESIKTMINYQFENGTITWIDSESVIPYVTDNGDVSWKPIMKVINIRKMEDYQEKIIHLDTGKTEYTFKHIDFIGSKSKLSK